MTTIPEATVLGQFRHLREYIVQFGARAPRLKFAQSRRVHQNPARRNPEQFAPRGRVASARIALAHRARVLPFFAQQGIDQRGFTNAGGSQQRRRPVAPQPRAQPLQPFLPDCADRHRGHLRRHRARLLQPRFHVPAQVRLVQHDHRLRPAPAHQRQTTLQPAQIEPAAAIQRADQKDRVHVRRQHLLARRPPRSLTR